MRSTGMRISLTPSDSSGITRREDNLWPHAQGSMCYEEQRVQVLQGKKAHSQRVCDMQANVALVWYSRPVYQQSLNPREVALLRRF